MTKCDKFNKSIQKQMMIQLNMLNNSNIKICKAIERLDQKVQIIMKSDSRTRNFDYKIPALPPAFIDILPSKSMAEVDVVESLLLGESGVEYKEELVR